MAALVQVMAGLNAAPAVWRSAFQEMDMDRATSLFLVEYINKGRAPGHDEGVAAMHRVLRQSLEQRAGSSMPEDVRLRIEAEKDSAKLEQWCGDGLKCSTWEDARKLLRLPSGS